MKRTSLQLRALLYGLSTRLVCNDILHGLGQYFSKGDDKSHELYGHFLCIGVGRHAYRLQLLEPAAALVRDNHTDCAAPVLLFAHKHAIKILILGLRHPRHR